MWWAKYLLSGFSFLAVDEDAPFLHTKRVLEIVLPGVLTALSVLMFIFWGRYTVPGLLHVLDDKLFQLVIFMVPFHLAALAALATFQSHILDQELLGAPASMQTWSEQDNAYFRRPLKMREYACRLFGYLCTLGVIYLVVSIVAALVDFNAIGLPTVPGVRWVIFAVIAAFFWHYIVMSLFAIYFLISKTV